MFFDPNTVQAVVDVTQTVNEEAAAAAVDIAKAGTLDLAKMGAGIGAGIVAVGAGLGIGPF